GLGGVAGVAGTAAGAFILGAPKVKEFREALDVLGPSAQKAGKLVEGAGKAAGAAVAFFALAHGANAAADAFGLMGEKVKGAEDTMSFVLDGEVDRVFAGLSKGKTGVDDLSSALDKLLDDNWETAFNRWGSDVFAFTGLDSSVGKARDAFDQVGKSLADLVNN